MQLLIGSFSARVQVHGRPLTLLVLVLAYLEGKIMEQRNTKCFLARDNMIICTRVAISAATLVLLRAFFSSRESMFSGRVQELQEGVLLLLYQWVPWEYSCSLITGHCSTEDEEDVLREELCGQEMRE